MADTTYGMHSQQSELPEIERDRGERPAYMIMEKTEIIEVEKDKRIKIYKEWNGKN